MVDDGLLDPVDVVGFVEEVPQFDDDGLGLEVPHGLDSVLAGCESLVPHFDGVDDAVEGLDSLVPQDGFGAGVGDEPQELDGLELELDEAPELPVRELEGAAAGVECEELAPELPDRELEDGVELERDELEEPPEVPDRDELDDEELEDREELAPDDPVLL